MFLFRLFRNFFNFPSFIYTCGTTPLANILFSIFLEVRSEIEVNLLYLWTLESKTIDSLLNKQHQHSLSFLYDISLSRDWLTEDKLIIRLHLLAFASLFLVETVPKNKKIRVNETLPQILMFLLFVICSN